VRILIDFVFSEQILLYIEWLLATLGL